MTRYETRTVDRRADYYARIARLIPATAFRFYARADQGRQWQEQFRLRGNAEKLLSQHRGNVVALKPNTTKAAKAAKGI